MFEDQKPLSRIALKIGIAGVIGFGALATGMFATRKGRHLVREAWQGRERTRIEDRVLDTIWDDPRIARRRIDVREVKPGHIELMGRVRTIGERRRTVRLVLAVPGVQAVDDHLEVVPQDNTRVSVGHRRPPGE
jgi:osmotically-inducible protein OsmY